MSHASTGDIYGDAFQIQRDPLNRFCDVFVIWFTVFSDCARYSWHQ